MKYPCLYNKTEKRYIERDQVKDTWKAVAEALLHEEGNFFIKAM